MRREEVVVTWGRWRRRCSPEAFRRFCSSYEPLVSAQAPDCMAWAQPQRCCHTCRLSGQDPNIGSQQFHG
jgi:hypothetical protein